MEKNLMYLLEAHPRLQMCLEGFNKYKNDLKSKEPGLYSYVVVDPKTYRKSILSKSLKTISLANFESKH